MLSVRVKKQSLLPRPRIHGDLNAAVTDDVLTVSLTTSDPEMVNGLGGGCIIPITQYQQRDGSDIQTIPGATNVTIKFDYGVEITGFSETSRFGGR